MEDLTMGLSATQPAAAVSLDAIFALASPANTSMSSTFQATPFENLLGDAFSQVLSLPASLPPDDVSDHAVQAPLKNTGEHKKQDLKNDDAESTGSNVTLCPFVAAPVPMIPPPDQFVFTAPVVQKNANQSQAMQVPAGEVRFATVQLADSGSLAKGISGNKTEMSDATAAGNFSLSFGKTFSDHKTQNLCSITQNQPAPRSVASSPLPEPPTRSADSQPAEKAVNRDALAVSRSSQDWFASADTQSEAEQTGSASMQLGLDIASAASDVDIVGTDSLAKLVSHAIIHPSPDATPASPHSPDAIPVLPVQSPAPELPQSEKLTAVIAQVQGFELPRAQAASAHHQHVPTDLLQNAFSGLVENKKPTDLPKFFGNPDILQRTPQLHHVAINVPKASNDISTKADAPGFSTNTADPSGTAAHGEEHKPSETPDQSSGSQNLRPTTMVLPSTQAIVPQAANSPSAPPAGMPVVPTQTASPSATPPTSEIKTSSSLPVHDVQVPAPVMSVPIQVHAARIFQADNRTEMRLDMQTQAFGGIEIHTSVSGKDIQLSVNAEHGDLHNFLAMEMPMLQSNLQQHDLRLEQVHTLLNSGTQRDFSPGSDKQQQGFSRPQPQPHTFDQPREFAGILDEEDSPSGLSIRI